METGDAGGGSYRTGVYNTLKIIFPAAGIVIITVIFVMSKISMFFNVPASTKDYAVYHPLLIPLVFIADYFSRAWISLLFAFILAGIISEYIPQDLIKKILGKRKLINYITAAAAAPLFITCSCSVIPIYVSILLAGATPGVAMTFFLMAPAANFITLFMTGEYIGWDLVIWRLIFSIIAAVICGILFDKTGIARKIAEKYKGIREGKASRLEIRNLPSQRLIEVYKQAYSLAKSIIPYLILGLAAVSYLAAYISDEWISSTLTGIKGIVIAAIVGGPLYTPTLVEIVLTRALLDKGMGRATALSFVMGQPYDIVSMFPNSKYFTWKGVGLYTVIFFIFSILSGILYGIVYGILL